MKPSQFSTPRTLDVALAELAQDGGCVLAGGTDVYPALVGRELPDRVLDISRIAGLRGLSIVERNDETVMRIGACTTWTDIAESDLRPGFRALRQVARQIGAVQVQNAGTIAGNVCTASPVGDSIPVLLALDATVELQSQRGTRRVPLSAFITGYRTTLRAPDELVVALELPISQGDHVSSFVRFGTRSHLVISLAMVAVSVARDSANGIVSARVAVGACSPVAVRLASVESKVVTGATVRVDDSDLAELAPIDDIRCSAQYRTTLVPELIARALEACGVEVA